MKTAMNYLRFAARRARLFVLLSFLALTAAGCDAYDDDGDFPDAPPSAIYEENPNIDPRLGELVVYAFGGARYEPVRNADVFVFATLEDYEQQIPLFSGFTDRNGRVNMGLLQPGNYYIEVVAFAGETRFSILEASQAQAGYTLTRNIIVY